MRTQVTMPAAGVAFVYTVVLAAASVLAAGVGLEPTPAVGKGPNHREGAPYRGKLSPPHAKGTVLVIRGHVLSSDTGEPLAGVVLDAFHADADGRYDTNGYNYRARVVTDDSGYYEFETVRPRSYGPPPHIHFVISHAGYRTLDTTLRFKGGSGGPGFPSALIAELMERESGGKTYEEGTFNVVLAAE